MNAFRLRLAVSDVLMRTVVVALGAFGDLYAARLPAAAEECLGGWVDEVVAADVDEIVVEPYGQRVGDGHPAALAVGRHLDTVVRSCCGYTLERHGYQHDGHDGFQFHQLFHSFRCLRLL